jgi:TusA-related sulfurtransferase
VSAHPPGGAEPVTVVDARGLRCPLPVIRLAQAARGLPAGSVLELWATDPAARADVPAWCRMRGHELLATTEAEPDLHPGGQADAAVERGTVERGTVGHGTVGHGTEGGHTAYRVRLLAP